MSTVHRGVTMKQSVALLRLAQAEGIAITGAVPGRHLTLTDEAVETSVYDTSTRLLPPLRSDVDRQACVEGVKGREGKEKEGKIKCFA